MRVLLGAIVLGLTALTAGFIGFQAGIASNIGAAGGAVYLGGGVPWFGFPWFGFLFFFLFIGFLFFAFGGRRRGSWGPYGGHGRMGYGPWGDDTNAGGPTSGDPRRQWIADEHRRLHEAEARASAGQAATGASTPSEPTQPPAG
jgi:hypothetical protein